MIDTLQFTGRTRATRWMEIIRATWGYRAWIALVTVGGGLLVAWLFRDAITSYGPSSVHAARILLPVGTPGSPLGTDAFGRDLTSRLLAGVPISILAGAIPAAAGMALGMSIGLVAGMRGGLVDGITMSVMDLFLSFPFILLALLFIAILGRSTETMVIAVSIALVPKNARLVRAETLSVRERDYVTAARLAGVGPFHILVRHLLPNVFPVVLIVGSTDVGLMIGGTAGLSFLGLGVQPPAVDWGTLVSDGAKYITSAPHLALLPSLLVAVVSVLFVLIGDDLRHRLSRSE